jgi:hypothetical protein
VRLVISLAVEYLIAPQEHDLAAPLNDLLRSLHAHLAEYRVQPMELSNRQLEARNHPIVKF